jgi:hypothetical protein
MAPVGDLKGVSLRSFVDLYDAIMDERLSLSTVKDGLRNGEAGLATFGDSSYDTDGPRSRSGTFCRIEATADGAFKCLCSFSTSPC